jgi:predicted DNA-binding transcriptional regulator YafY
MPVDKQVLLRYQVLNECFRNKYRDYTIDDLVDECSKAMREKLDIMDGVSKRTIQNDIANLEMPPYNIRLDEKLKSGRKRLFRYLNTDDTLHLFRMNDEERHKVQDAIRVLNDYEGEPLYDWARMFLMQVEGGMFDEDSSSIVSFQSNPDLKGLSHFGKLLQAIISKRVLRMRYTPFGKDTITVKIHPYHLKQYNDRWYLIGFVEGYHTYGHYPLDRIEDFEEIAVKYQEPEEDFEGYFDDVVGVTVPEGDSQDIIIKVYKESMGFFTTKPLHLSQRVIEKSNDYMIITINVKTNYELDSKILSFGPSVEILSPESYRTHISDKIRAMNENYLNDAENLHT